MPKGIYERKYKHEMMPTNLDNISTWLYQHGGRNAGDLFQDKNGLYVLMSSGTKDVDVRVYLPIK